MAYQLQIRRGTAAQWTAANPTLGNGEMGLEEDTQLAKMGNGVDAWNDLDYWPPPAASETKRAYGRMIPVFIGDVYPLAPSQFEHRVRLNGHWDLYNSFPYYSDCLWRVEAGSTILGEDLTFASLNDIQTYINANVPNSGGQFDTTAYVHCYDKVDGSIPPVSTVYGKNGLLSRLKKNNQYYWHNAGLTSVTLFRYPEAANVLHALWLEIWGTALAGAPGTWTDNETRCFWWGANGKRMYDMPNSSALSAMNIVGGGNRFCKDSGGTRVPAASHGFYWSPSRQPRYVSIWQTNGTLFETMGLTDSGRRFAGNFYRGNSILCGIPLESGFGETAVYIKPVGIDQIYLSYVDPTKYRIEFVGGSNRDVNRRIRPSGAVEAHEEQGTGPITIDKWWPVCSRALTSYHGHGPVSGRVSIQLRDLTTKKVSAYSAAQLKWLHRKRLRPFCCVVETRP